jgi:hypothetical protein
LTNGFEKGSFSYSSFNIASCSSYSAPFSLATTSVDLIVPDELFWNYTKYTISKDNKTLYFEELLIYKLSSSLNKYYIKEVRPSGSNSFSVN